MCRSSINVLEHMSDHGTSCPPNVDRLHLKWYHQKVRIDLFTYASCIVEYGHVIIQVADSISL